MNTAHKSIMFKPRGTLIFDLFTSLFMLVELRLDVHLFFSPSNKRNANKFCLVQLARLTLNITFLLTFCALTRAQVSNSSSSSSGRTETIEEGATWMQLFFKLASCFLVVFSMWVCIYYDDTSSSCFFFYLLLFHSLSIWNLALYLRQQQQQLELNESARLWCWRIHKSSLFFVSSLQATHEL